MIADKDIEKLKEIFVTKDEFYIAIKELIELITGGFNRVDKALEKLEVHDNTLSNHERRLDKLEDKVFA